MYRLKLCINYWYMHDIVHLDKIMQGYNKTMPKKKFDEVKSIKPIVD